MKAVESVLELIGETPVVRLGALEPDGGAEIWAKLESMSPGGSVKDRIGLGMILAAEADGRLAPGGTIVEATAGNTGVGLAVAGVQRGYRVILFVPRRYSREKQELMRALGAELHLVSDEEGMDGAMERARATAEDVPGALYIDQFSNRANAATHADTTGPELLAQLGGRIDAAVIGCGSGGTFSGVVRFLKQRLPGLLAVAVESEGSILGGGPKGSHAVEGIGMDSIPESMEMELVDEVETVSDREAFATVGRLARGCGVLGGSSAGANVAAAIRVSSRLGTGRRVATVIPDSAERYLSQEIFTRFEEGGR